MKPLKTVKRSRKLEKCTGDTQSLKVALTLYIASAVPSVFNLQCISKAKYILNNLSVVFQILNSKIG